MGWMNILGWGGEDTTQAGKNANATTDSSNDSGWYNEAFNWYHSDPMQGARNELDKSAAKVVKEVVSGEHAKTTDENKKKYQDIKNKTDISSFDFSKNLQNKNVLYVAGAAIILTAFMYFDKNKKK